MSDKQSDLRQESPINETPSGQIHARSLPAVERLFCGLTGKRPDHPPGHRNAAGISGTDFLPNKAPPATRTQTTGQTNPDPTTRKMNENEKRKIEIEGK